MNPKAASLQSINSELEKVQRMLDLASDSDASRALILKQAQLLESRARSKLRQNQIAQAIEDASHVVTLAEALARSSDEEFAREASVVQLDGLVTRGMAQLEARRRSDARESATAAAALLARTSTNAGQAAAQLAEGSSRLQELENSLAREDELDAAVDDEFVERYWEPAEDQLETLISEIAERIVRAGALMARVAEPDRFQGWLVARIDAETSRIRKQPRPLPEPPTWHDQAVADARDRGRDAQLQIWLSDEMIRADALGLGAGKRATDEDLLPYRKSGSLLGLPHPSDESQFAYPVWQFDPKTSTVIQSVFRLLSQLPPWSRWHFFHRGSPLLYELSPLEVLGIAPLRPPNAPDDDRLQRILEAPGGAAQAVELAARDYAGGED
jgi:hypothetical protein